MMSKGYSWIWGIVLVSCFSVGSALAEGDRFVVTPGQKQLFLDDFAVAKVDGLKRTMHAPQKLGAVIRPDILSDGRSIQSRSAPMWVADEGVYKLIYTAYTMDNHAEIGAALAVSKDGVHWEKPTLDQGIVVRGSTENNRIHVDPSLHWGANALECTVYDGDDPDPSRRYKGFLGSIGREPVAGPDGITWRRLGTPKVPSSDEASLTYDRHRKQFIALLKGGSKYGRAANISLSNDFAAWTKPCLCFATDDEDQVHARQVIAELLADPTMPKPLFVEPDPAVSRKKPTIPIWRAECYNLAVFPYEGVYIGLPCIYYPTGLKLPQRNNTDGFSLIQLAVSRDLNLWKRLGQRKAFIGPSPIDKGLPGVYDRIQILPLGDGPIERDDELWFYYVGLKFRANPYDYNQDGSKRDPATLSAEEKADLKEGTGAICLAVLRKDGFVSLDVENDCGYVLTKPFSATGTQLFVNLDAGETGFAQVEVLNQDGSVFSGFARDDAVAIEGDGVRQQVVWQRDSDWGSLKGATAQLRIHLKGDARLYAFWSE